MSCHTARRRGRGRQRRSPAVSRLLASLLAIVVAMALATPVRAAVRCNVAAATGLELVGSFSVPANLPLYSPVDTSATANFSFYCHGASHGDHSATVRVRFADPGQVIVDPNGGLIVPTTLPGVGLRLTGSPMPQLDNAIGGYVFGTTDGRGRTGGQVSGSITAQLVKTGPVGTGTVAMNNPLLHFDYVAHGQSSRPLTDMSISGSEHVDVYGCSVQAGSANLAVTLPTVGSGQFNGVGAVAGDTPFHIALQCQSGTTVHIQFDANGRGDPNHQGVILPAAGDGDASGIGVQLLDGGGDAVTFGHTQSVGMAPDGPMSIPLRARYFQTGATVGGGQVSATVTFTLTYQ